MARTGDGINTKVPAMSDVALNSDLLVNLDVAANGSDYSTTVTARRGVTADS
jgi:hypothetical protein